MYTVKITAKRLNELRMLADWQLRELGFDPASVTAACESAKNPRHGRSTDWHPSPEAELSSIGAELLKAEDRHGQTKTGWWLDGVWLAPKNDPTGALRAIKGG